MSDSLNESANTSANASADESVIDLDRQGEGFVSDPYPFYSGLRARGPVHRVRSAELGEQWLIVGHEEARAALADPRLSKDPAKAGAPSSDDAVARHLLTMDPPDHTRLRALVEREFTAARAEEMRAGVQRIADELLDAMLPAGRGDLVDAFALPLPAVVICELLGVPAADRDRFRAWTASMTAPDSESAMATAFAELGAYIAELVAEKGRAPGDDLISALLDPPAEQDDRLTPGELISLVFLLILAGFETTAHLISNAVRTLLLNPGQLAELRADFSLLDNAVDEVMRYEGPVEATTFRVAVEAIEVGPVTIEAGSLVKISLPAVNRDERRFADPDRFDIHRPAGGHLSFGHGIHHCLGAPLARLEARIALRSLLERAPGLALDGDPEKHEWIPGLLVRGVRSLPVTF
ncbi:cytochrome P450 [Streptomyces sp. NBC_01485]|uniref:cytochrome P450 family protein n=1 Tax=Streptomyces sp. NBC_01485 TaxID=2903884 RepID=UPI002E2F1651|nr:cytochrome P450 [Streptomyces sp. NBC_01485]